MLFVEPKPRLSNYHPTSKLKSNFERKPTKRSKMSAIVLGEEFGRDAMSEAEQSLSQSTALLKEAIAAWVPGWNGTVFNAKIILTYFAALTSGIGIGMILGGTGLLLLGVAELWMALEAKFFTDENTSRNKHKKSSQK
jgi:hypothetical protein